MLIWNFELLGGGLDGLVIVVGCCFIVRVVYVRGFWLWFGFGVCCLLVSFLVLGIWVCLGLGCGFSFLRFLASWLGY